jgi:hypothetical protein
MECKVGYASALVLPRMSIEEAFQRVVGKAQIKVNKEQSRNLPAVRDTLLPKPLSGELSVSDFL